MVTTVRRRRLGLARSNSGSHLMSNGLTRLATRFLDDDVSLGAAKE